MADDDGEKESSGGILDWLFGSSRKDEDETPENGSRRGAHGIICEGCGSQHGNYYSLSNCSCRRSDN